MLSLNSYLIKSILIKPEVNTFRGMVGGVVGKVMGKIVGSRLSRRQATKDLETAKEFILTISSVYVGPEGDSVFTL